MAKFTACGVCQHLLGKPPLSNPSDEKIGGLICRHVFHFTCIRTCYRAQRKGKGTRDLKIACPVCQKKNRFELVELVEVPMKHSDEVKLTEEQKSKFIRAQQEKLNRQIELYNKRKKKEEEESMNILTTFLEGGSEDPFADSQEVVEVQEDEEDKEILVVDLET